MIVTVFEKNIYIYNQTKSNSDYAKYWWICLLLLLLISPRFCSGVLWHWKSCMQWKNKQTSFSLSMQWTHTTINDHIQNCRQRHHWTMILCTIHAMIHELDKQTILTLSLELKHYQSFRKCIKAVMSLLFQTFKEIIIDLLNPENQVC